MSRPARPKRTPPVQEYPLGDEALVYLPSTGTAHALNPSARAIFDLCDGTRTAEDIAGRLAWTVGCSTRDILPDVLDGLKRLRELDLVQ